MPSARVCGGFDIEVAHLRGKQTVLIVRLREKWKRRGAIQSEKSANPTIRNQFEIPVKSLKITEII